MALQIMSVMFDDASLGMRGTRTDDGQVLSVLFDNLMAESQPADSDAAPQVRRAEGLVRCNGTGWLSVHVRGAVMVTGAHGYAHALGWANGRRLRLAPQGLDEPMTASISAPVGADGQLRLSLLLLAQRDLHEQASAAVCWLDSIDIAVLPLGRTKQAAGGR